MEQPIQRSTTDDCWPDLFTWRGKVSKKLNGRCERVNLPLWEVLSIGRDDSIFRRTLNEAKSSWRYFSYLQDRIVCGTKSYLIGSRQVRISESNKLTSTSGQASKAWIRCLVWLEAICPIISSSARVRVESEYIWILITVRNMYIGCGEQHTSTTPKDRSTFLASQRYESNLDEGNVLQ